MAAKEPLKGIELVDCARANAKQGIKTAAYLCGYGDDLPMFSQELQHACDHMGVEYHELADLIPEEWSSRRQLGVEIAPDTPNNL
jgi:hypothetical protein